MNIITEDFFCPMDIFSYKVSKKEIANFKKAALDSYKPNEYILETNDGMFKITQDERVFMILMRKYEYTIPEEMDYDIDEIDSNVMMIFKIAKSSGFKVFLEQKYSN
jgi:hypothetical protein